MFVGHAVDLEKISVAYDQVRRTLRTHTVLVRGPVGMGKSTLLRSWLEKRRDANTLILVGEADRTDSGVPLAAFRDAIASAQSYTQRPEFNSALRTFEESVGPTMTGTSSTGKRSVAATEAFALLVEQGALPGTIPIIVVEDIHFADSDTLDLCTLLARQHNGRPILLIMSIRPGYGAKTDDMVALVERQVGRDLGTIIDLAPLSRRQVEAILTTELPAPPTASLVRRIHTFTEGNPLFLRLVLEDVQQAEGFAVINGRTTAPVSWHPTAPHDLLRRSVAPTEDELQVGAAFALVGRNAQEKIEVVAAGTQLSTARTRDLLDAMTAKGILVATKNGVTFSHPAFRETFEASLGHQSKRETHRRMAEYLRAKLDEGQQVDLFELASHICKGYDSIDEHALSILCSAGESALRLAPIAAADWYSCARRGLPPGDSRNSEILAKQLLGLGLASETSRAVSLIEKVLSDIPDAHRSPRLNELITSMFYSSRRQSDGLALLAAVPPAQHTVWMRSVRLALLAAHGTPREGLAEFESLIADIAADPQICPPIVLHYLLTYCAVIGDAARLEDILAWMHRACLGVDANTRGLLSNLALVFCRISPRGRAAADEFRPIRYGSPGQEGDFVSPTDDAGTAATGGTYLQYLMGRWDSAAEYLPEDLTKLWNSGNILGYEFPAGLYAHIQVSRDDLGEAKRILDEIGTESGVYFAFIEAVRGSHLMASGNLDLAIVQMTSALERVSEAGIIYFSEYLTDWLCEALIMAGRREEAQNMVEPMYERLRPLKLPMVDVHIYRAYARATGDIEAAHHSLRMAAPHFTSFEEARTRTVLGQLGENSHENLSSAHALFGTLRARTEQRKTEAIMREHGVPVPRLKATATTLTAVEGEILKLVAKGKSTRVIASELNYSPKTVEMHLSRMYSRTNNHGRIALVRAFSQGELSIL